MPSTPSAPKIEYRHNVAREEHEIGVRQGKHFVAFASIPDAAFDAAVERSENTVDSPDDDEGEG